jgi:SPRY domain-containing SOCS box protein 1/4
MYSGTGTFILYFCAVQVPDKFQMVLDMDEGTLAFLVEGHYLGVAHSGLRGRKLHVIVR